MLLPKECRYRLCETVEGSPQPVPGKAGPGYPVLEYFGYDPVSKKFVAIGFWHASAGSSGPQLNSLRQRLDTGKRLKHSGIARLFEHGATPNEGWYYVRELVEGESFLEYLKRNPDLPSETLGVLLLQLAEAISYLTDFPRLLSSLKLSDFSVTLDRGIFPGVRLSDYGLSREDQPMSDFQIADSWCRKIASLHCTLMEGATVNDADSGEINHPIYSPALDLLKKKSGVDAILHLRDFGQKIREAAGFPGDLGARIPVEIRRIQKVGQVGIGPLQKLVFESGELEAAISERFVLRPDAVRFSYSPFNLSAAKAEDPEDKVQLYILPPERLFEETIVESLNRKMFDSYLKTHPNGVRVRSFGCEYDYTLIVSERFSGFPLPSLQARRTQFSVRDAMAIAQQLDRILYHFESAEFDLGELNPWQIEIFFESEASENIPGLIENTEIRNWPAWDLKLRVEPPAEAFVESFYSPWSYLVQKFDGKTFPALIAWLLDSDRFEWALSAGLEKSEPLSWNPFLDSLLTSAIRYFDPSEPSHRSGLIKLVKSIFEKDNLIAFNEEAALEDGWDFREAFATENGSELENRLLRVGVNKPDFDS